MLRLLFLLFIVMPIVEMVILIKVGGTIGALNTIALVLLTAVWGAWLLRRQGLATLLRAQQRLQLGEAPAQEILEGFVLAVGGALLLTPGFVTDCIGFCCLFPATRAAMVKLMLRSVLVEGSRQADMAFRYQAHSSRPSQPGASGDVIEGEFKRDD